MPVVLTVAAVPVSNNLLKLITPSLIAKTPSSVSNAVCPPAMEVSSSDTTFSLRLLDGCASVRETRARSNPSNTRSVPVVVPLPFSPNTSAAGLMPAVSIDASRLTVPRAFTSFAPLKALTNDSSDTSESFVAATTVNGARASAGAVTVAFAFIVPP